MFRFAINAISKYNRNLGVSHLKDVRNRKMLLFERAGKTGMGKRTGEERTDKAYRSLTYLLFSERQFSQLPDLPVTILLNTGEALAISIKNLFL